jgi:hypothetical protein
MINKFLKNEQKKIRKTIEKRESSKEKINWNYL